MDKNDIIDLDCKKHIKIYKLSQLGLKKKEVADLVNTNYGHVYNVLKDYESNPEKVNKANELK